MRGIGDAQHVTPSLATPSPLPQPLPHVDIADVKATGEAGQGIRRGFLSRPRRPRLEAATPAASAPDGLTQLPAEPRPVGRGPSMYRRDAMVVAADLGRLRATSAQRVMGPTQWGVADFVSPQDGARPMSVNHRHRNGFTPLAAAASAGHAAVVSFLVAHGASTLQPVWDARDSVQRRSYPLHMALSWQNYHTAEVLLLREAQRGTSRSWDLLDGRPGGPRQTPLHLAAAADQPILVARLLEVGASPAAQGRYFEAQHRGPGDDAGAVDYDTPLHIAARSGHLDCVRRMVGLGDNDWRRHLDQFHVDLRNALGQTALHAAAQSANSAVVEALLSAGYSRSAADHAGHTPLAVALRLLASAQADRDERAAAERRQVVGVLQGRWRRILSCLAGTGGPDTASPAPL